MRRTTSRAQILLLRDRDAEPLVPGAAHACALAELRAGGVARRAFQWCRDVKLVVK